MSFHNYLFAILLAATGLMLFIAYLSGKQRRQPVAKYLTLVMLAASLYAFGYAFELSSKDLDRIQFWLKIEYLGIPFISTLWLLLVIEFTGFRPFLTRWVRALLFLIPIATLIMHFTNDWHHLYYRELWLDENAAHPMAMTVKGHWYWVHIGYNYAQAAAGTILFMVTFMKAVPVIRKQILVMLLGASAPWIFSMLYLFGTFGPGIDLTPIGFTLSGACYLWGIYRLNLMRLAPIAMQKVFETMNDGVLLLDADHRIQHSNPAARTMLPGLRDGKENATAREMFAQEPELLSKIMTMDLGDCRMQMKREGRLCHVHLKVSMLYHGDLALGKLLILQDITKEVEDQDQIVTQVKQLAELNAFKDKLFTVVAHDIRDPLAVLINLTELLEEELQAAGHDQIDLFKEVSGQVRNTFILVETVLDWFRTQRGHVAFSPLVWRLSPLIQESLLAARMRSELKEIQITSLVGEELEVYADKSMFGLILRNLLSNAIKFTPIGGEVHVEAVRKADCIQIAVSDTGLGVAPELADSLLRGVLAASLPGTEGEKGTGLGLYLTREFVEIHGGSIWYDSVPGKGSTFYFMVPASARETNPIEGGSLG
ncbi:ATP-binding protein [Paenibacillus sp. TRM 82003]|nr:ATP-binding protein [Paenibacillus sp. TRM 82003]